MALFEDEFTEASDTQLKSHTPNVGTAWTNVDGETFGILSSSNELTGETTQGNFSAPGSVRTDDLGQDDKQIWFKRIAWNSTNSDILAAVRLVDGSNGIGHRLGGTGGAGRRLSDLTSGSFTDLITSQGVNGEWIRVKCESDAVSLWEGGTGSEPTDPTADTNWTQVGTDQSTTDHKSTTFCGWICVGNSKTGFAYADSFRAHTVGGGSGGGTNVPAAMRHYAGLRRAA